MTQKQDLYRTKEKEIDYLFIEYLVTAMEYIEHPALIEEWIKNIDAAAYENNLYKDEKLPSIKKRIDRNDKTEYWPIIIVEISIGCLFLISWISLQTGQIMIKITKLTDDSISSMTVTRYSINK